MEFIQKEWKFFLVLFMCLGALAVGYSEYKQYVATHKPETVQTPNITVNTAGQPSKPGETQVVYVKGESTATKEIVYMPKETDPATGAKEKTDVEFTRKDNKVYVKVNGKEFEVPANVKEDAKFENGKLVVTEQTELRVNITAPKPVMQMGLGWSANGPAMQVNGPLVKNVSWWVYGDKKSVAGGLQFPIMH